MNLDDALRDLIDGAYAAALDSTRWSDWSWRTTQLLGGISSSFYVLAADGAIQHQAIHHTNMKAVDRYIDEAIYRLDPQIPFVVGLSQAQVFVDTDHLDLKDRGVAEYVAWQQSNGNLRHYATAAARLGGGSHFAGLSIHRAVADGPTPSHVRSFMDKLLPELQRALTLGFLHTQKLQAAYWDGLLAKTDIGALVEADGRLVRTTPGMETLLAGADALTMRHGKLVETHAPVDSKLEALIALSTTGPKRGGSCVIHRASGKPPFVVTAYPLDASSECLPAVNAVALITIVDPAVRSKSPIALWTNAFGLTPREVEVVGRLGEGHSLSSAAAILSMSESTARVHLKNIFAKTNTNRQSELMMLIYRLGQSG